MRFWRRVPSLFFTFGVLAGVASGCRERFWDPGDQLRPPDGGGVDAVRVDSGPRDHVTIDLTVWDLKHLSAIISELREKRVISRVERVVA